MTDPIRAVKCGLRFYLRTHELMNYTMKLNPLTIRKLRRFKSIKRGYNSFILIVVMISASFFAEILVNKRAIMVNHNGKYYFPIYGEMITGTTIGLD
jgi:microcin C transport system permease protein